MLPFKLGLGGPLAGGEQYMAWITLDDEVELILWALDDDKVSGVLNAAAPNPVTNREFSKAFGEALGRPAFMPAPKLAVVALRGRELADMVTSSARVIPRRAQDLGYTFNHPTVGEGLEAALNEGTSS
jgi:NAD dependent epimerase/dehydratase family enzyme